MKRTASKQKVPANQLRTAARPHARREETPDEMRPHYDFDYSKSRPNRFAARLNKDTIAVVLDPDVASVFHSAEAVNTFLRSAISAMPAPDTRKKKPAS